MVVVVVMMMMMMMMKIMVDDDNDDNPIRLLLEKISRQKAALKKTIGQKPLN